MSVDSPPAPVESSSTVGAHRIAVVDGRADRNGPATVYIHGIALSARLWPFLLRDTPLDRSPWISLGLPGHFPSSAPAGFDRGDVTVALFSDCVTGPVREYFGDAPVHLVGWSTGGFASFAAAMREPSLVSSVVSLSGFARGRWGSHLGTMQSLARRRLGQRVLRPAMRLYGRSPRLFQSFLQSLAKRRLELSGDLFDVLIEDYSRHDMAVLCELLAGIRELDLSSGLAEIEAPVLIVGGTADKVISSKEAHHLHEHLPNSELVELSEMGHMFFAEELEESLAEIAKWLERQSIR